jgi:hypothetical protein
MMKKFALALLALATALAITPAAMAGTITAGSTINVTGLITLNGTIDPTLSKVYATGVSGTFDTELPDAYKLLPGTAGSSDTYTLIGPPSGPIGDSFTVTSPIDLNLITFTVTTSTGPCTGGNLACGAGTISDGSDPLETAMWTSSSTGPNGTVSFTFDAITPAATPEPSSLLLLGTGLLGLAFVAFRKAKPARPVMHLSL